MKKSQLKGESVEIGFADEDGQIDLKSGPTNEIHDQIGGVAQSMGSPLKPSCIKCEQDLYLLAQFKTYIPVSSSQIRVLYVFGCNSCPPSAETFKVYRLNYIPKNSQKLPKKKPAPELTPPPSRSSTPLFGSIPSFGASPISFSSPKLNSIENFGKGSGTSLAELNDLLKSSSIQKKEEPKSPLSLNGIPPSDKKESHIKASVKDKPQVLTSSTDKFFPAFPLYFEEHQIGTKSSTQVQSRLPDTTMEDHVSQLLAAYKQAHPEEQIDKWATIDSSKTSSPSSGVTPKDWEDEQYEKMNIDGDKAFKKFRAFFEEFPGHCVRYQFDGSPLFFTSSDTIYQSLQQQASQTCPRCQSPRVFECQLMPPILSLLQTTTVTGITTDQNLENKNPNKKSLDIQGMNWGTILVYVCSKDCVDSTSQTVGISEELCYVQCES